MSDAAIVVVGLTKRFGTKTAVDKVTLSVPTGSVYGLIGPNGAGKTTTFSMLAGYLRPTAGSVQVLGFAPSAVDDLRGRLGVLPQDAILPATDTVGEFLIHMARLQDLPRDKALAAARGALDEVAGADWWRQRCGSLSHGMAKRVALAQAFLGEPEVVLLDEPTAGLDPRVAFEMRQLIKAKTADSRPQGHRDGAAARRRTVLISSHNLQELEEICDGAAILDRGRLITAGVMGELTASNEEVRIQLAPGARRGTERGEVPLAPIRDLPTVAGVDYDDERGELVISVKRQEADPETVIGQVLSILLKNEVAIRGVVKGRGLEQRVMDLT
jgi:ABC-type multidrug transport system ATPase subunit